MVEQQVVFKKCMLSMLALVANNLLDTYLTEDLTRNGSTNSFYTQRRQLTLNHRLGGDPTRNDQITWFKTIGSNPALLRIDRYIPWWEVVTDSKIKNNIQKAIVNRLEQVVKERKEQEIQHQDTLGLTTINISVGLTLPKIVYQSSTFSFHEDGKQCSIIGSVTVNISAICPNECNLSQLVLTKGTFDRCKNLFTYVRDNSTGSFHIVFKNFQDKYTYIFYI